MRSNRQKGILQRRQSVAGTVQAALDGIFVLALLFFSVRWFEQAFTLAYLLLGIFLLGTMSVCYLLLGTYRRHASTPGQLLKLLVSWGTVWGVLTLTGFLLGILDVYSRKVVLTLMVGGFLGQFLIHVTMLWLQRRKIAGVLQSDNTAGFTQERALVVGNNEYAIQLARQINSNPWLGLRVAGLLSVYMDPEALKDPELPVLGKVDEICEIVQQRGIRAVYFALPLHYTGVLEEIYFQLLDLNVDITWAPDVFSLKLVNFNVREIGGMPLLALSETPLQGNNAISKWIEDKLLAGIALILFSPVMLLAALAIKLNSRGPVIYKQARTGWDGKEFYIWKFRSMRAEPPETDQVIQASREDPRITRVGRFIRRTSIDELPQLFNVLGGSMSMVGPRPHAVQHNVQYSEEIRAYLARHRIKPGITGWAQVNGLRGETETKAKMKKRVAYDLYYINHWSIWFDLWILIRTAFVVLRQDAY